MIIGSIVILLIGIYCAISKKNLIKILIGLIICLESVHLLLISIGYEIGSTTTQAMTITSMVLSGCTLGILGSLIFNLYKSYKTLDTSKIRRLKW